MLNTTVLVVAVGENSHKVCRSSEGFRAAHT
nr:MAG TPA: hypothetical protein [Inoviridae sp.]